MNSLRANTGLEAGVKADLKTGRKASLKTRLYIASFAVLLHSAGVFAEEIKVLSSVGIKAVVDELAPQFEKATKHKVTTVFGLAGAHKTQIEKGEPFDVAIL